MTNFIWETENYQIWCKQCPRNIWVKHPIIWILYEYKWLEIKQHKYALWYYWKRCDHNSELENVLLKRN